MKLGRMKSVRASTKYASKHEGLCRSTADPSTGRNFLSVRAEFEGKYYKDWKKYLHNRRALVSSRPEIS